MLQLIIKDFRANWMFQLLSLAVLFAISTVFIYIMIKEKGRADPELVIYFMAVILSSAIVSLLFLKVDEIYQTDEIFASLPVTRSEIVLAKYAASFVQILLALTVHFFGTQLGAYIQGSLDYPALETIYQPMLWLSILTLLLLFSSYSFPFYFKFGLSKGVLIVVIIQFFLIVIGVLSYGILNPLGYIQDFTEWLSNQSINAILATFIGLFLVILNGSMVLSTKFYKNKDI